MDNKEFKRIFNNVAKIFGFKKFNNFWYKESEETIFTIYLQKSNFGNYYQLIYRIYIKGFFNDNFILSEDFKINKMPNAISGNPNEYDFILNMANEISPEDIPNHLNKLFKEHTNYIAERALSKMGIIELYRDKLINIFPGSRKELGIE